jgi:hypothetical protein
MDMSGTRKLSLAKNCLTSGRTGYNHGSPKIVRVGAALFEGNKAGELAERLKAAVC